MLDRTLILWVKLLFVDRPHPQSNKFAMGVKIKATALEMSAILIIEIHVLHCITSQLLCQASAVIMYKLFSFFSYLLLQRVLVVLRA